MKRRTRWRNWVRHRGLDGLMLVFAAGGLLIQLVLLSNHLPGAGGGIAGCGGGPCDEILASRWSKVFGIPVVIPGVLAYLALIVSMRPGFSRWNIPLLGVIAGSAYWFTFVQHVLLERFCPWCMLVHCIGISLLGFGLLRGPGRLVGETALRALRWLAAGFLAIGLAQVYGPVPASHRIEEWDAPGMAPSASHPPSGRTISFGGGTRTFDVQQLPRIGPADAPLVIVEYFDYQCAACARMAGFVETLIARHPGKLAVILLPVPLGRDCNPGLPPRSERPGACRVARTALAIWRSRPDAFPDFHKKLLEAAQGKSGRIGETTRTLALGYIGPDQLTAATQDPWVDEVLRSNIADWKVLSKNIPKLPKLLLPTQRVLHGLPSGEQEFIEVMERELNLK